MGKALENRTKEGPRMGVRTAGGTNSPPGQPNLHRAGSGGGEKNIEKEAPKSSPWPLLLASFGSAHPEASRMYFPFLPNKTSVTLAPPLLQMFAAVRQNQGNYRLP